MPPQQEANEADIHPVQEGHVTIVYIFLLYRRGLLVRRGRLAGGAGLAQPAQPIRIYIYIYIYIYVLRCIKALRELLSRGFL